MSLASKTEFSTSYLFEEQGTSECSEWFQIDLKCDQGALSDSYNQSGIIQNRQRYLTPQTNIPNISDVEEVLEIYCYIYIRNSKVGDRQRIILRTWHFDVQKQFEMQGGENFSDRNLIKSW